MDFTPETAAALSRAVTAIQAALPESSFSLSFTAGVPAEYAWSGFVHRHNRAFSTHTAEPGEALVQALAQAILAPAPAAAEPETALAA